MTDPSSPANPNARRHGRVLCRDIACSLGVVQDLSLSGMRVRTGQKPPKPGQSFGVDIRTGEERVYLHCVARWAKRCGIFRHEVGVEFVNLGTEQRRSLTAIARSCVYNELVRYVPDSDAA